MNLSRLQWIDDEKIQNNLDPVKKTQIATFEKKIIHLLSNCLIWHLKALEIQLENKKFY